MGFTYLFQQETDLYQENIKGSYKPVKQRTRASPLQCSAPPGWGSANALVGTTDWDARRPATVPSDRRTNRTWTAAAVCRTPGRIAPLWTGMNLTSWKKDKYIFKNTNITTYGVLYKVRHGEMRVLVAVRQTSREQEQPNNSCIYLLWQQRKVK